MDENTGPGQRYANSDSPLIIELTCSAVLLSMLTVDPNQRTTMSALLNHPWCMT